MQFCVSFPGYQESKSLAYFSIGVPFEEVWLEKFVSANKKMLIVDTAMGIQKISMLPHSHEGEGHHNHSVHAHHNHEKEHEEHVHTGLDPHIWLSPILVKVQARNIYSALVKIDPANKNYYKKNLNSFISELKSLDKKIESILKPYARKPFMIFHPAWGYFALRYKLEQIAVEVQGKEPKPAQLVKLVKEAKAHNIKIVFVSPQFSQKGAKTISKSINGNVVVINPLAETWDENLVKVAEEIAKTYK